MNWININLFTHNVWYDDLKGMEKSKNLKPDFNILEYHRGVHFCNFNIVMLVFGGNIFYLYKAWIVREVDIKEYD